MNITESDISEKYEGYAGFSGNARKSRISGVKSVFRRGLEKKALRIISSSSNVPAVVRKKAESYLVE